MTASTEIIHWENYSGDRFYRAWCLVSGCHWYVFDYSQKTARDKAAAHIAKHRSQR